MTKNYNRTVSVKDYIKQNRSNNKFLKNIKRLTTKENIKNYNQEDSSNLMIIHNQLTSDNKKSNN